MGRIIRQVIYVVPRLRKQTLATKRFYTSHKSKDNWHFKDLKPFGELFVHSKQKAMFVVEPIDPVKYPNQDQATVEASDCRRIQCSCIDSSLRTEDHGGDSADHTDLLNCQHEIPIKFNIRADLQNSASLYVKGMEGGALHVNTQQGECTLKKVKIDDVCLYCGGPVTSHNVLHANGSIQTTDSNINIDKALGSNLSLSSDSGDIHIHALYVDKTDIKTQSGDVAVKACHRTTGINVEKKGNVIIGTLDGDLVAKVNQGNIDVHISQHNLVDLRVAQGNITLKLSESLNSQFHLEANNVDIDQQINCRIISTENQDGCMKISGEIQRNEKGIEDRKITAICKNGQIKVESLDWISSLKLGENTTS